MAKKGLVKAETRAVGRFRSLWFSYQNAKPGWHVVVPLGIGAFAGYALSWSWTMLDRGEYGVAMLLAFLFLVFGTGAGLAITRRILRALVVLLVVVITAFSALKIQQERGSKSWTGLWTGSNVNGENKPNPIPLSGNPLPDYASLPLVVNAAINWKKEFRMANNGEIPIYDIQVRGTEYILNETAMGQGRIEIEFFHVHSTVSGKPDFGIQQLGAHQWTPVYDLAHDFKFVDFPRNDERDRPDMSEWVRRHYVLRITFRDARDGLRYVSYKAVSGIRGIEMYENRLTAGETGGLNRQLDTTIPEILISHQRNMFPLASFERDYTLPQ